MEGFRAALAFGLLCLTASLAPSDAQNTASSQVSFMPSSSLWVAIASFAASISVWNRHRLAGECGAPQTQPVLQALSGSDQHPSVAWCGTPLTPSAGTEPERDVHPGQCTVWERAVYFLRRRRWPAKREDNASAAR